VKMGAGDLVQRATSDIDTVRRFLATQIEEVGRAVALNRRADSASIRS